MTRLTRQCFKRVSHEIVVWIFGTFVNNFEIENDHKLFEGELLATVINISLLNNFPILP